MKRNGFLTGDLVLLILGVIVLIGDESVQTPYGWAGMLIGAVFVSVVTGFDPSLRLK